MNLKQFELYFVEVSHHAKQKKTTKINNNNNAYDYYLIIRF